MIFRIASDGTSLTVEDGETGDSFTVRVKDAAEAQGLIARALADGVDSIRPAVKKGK